MRALLYSDWETLVMAEVERPDPQAGEVLVRVEAAGICGSELEAFRKRSPRRQPPLILGHEFTGTVEQVGSDVADWKPGDAVVVNAVIAGESPEAKRGDTHLCPNRSLFGMHRPGAFAEFVCVPASVIIPRPAEVDPVAAALSEPLANGVHVSNLLGASQPESVVVFGAGPIGLFVLQAIRRLLGSNVAVVDVRPDRLDVARQLGASLTITPEQVAVVREWTGENGLDAAVDAVGSETTKAASVRWIRPGGTAVWIGLHENTSPFDAYDLILAEKKLLGSYACTQAELATALEMITTGEVDALSWTTLWSLDEGVSAFRTMLNPPAGILKGVLLP